MLTDKLTGKTLEDAEQDLVSCIRDHAQANARFVAEVLQVIESSVEPQGERGIVLSGTQNIIDYPEYMSLDRAKKLCIAARNQGNAVRHDEEGDAA